MEAALRGGHGHESAVGSRRKDLGQDPWHIVLVSSDMYIATRLTGTAKHSGVCSD